MPKRHYKWDRPEDNEERARKHRERTDFDYEAEDFINQLYDLAAAGYYDYEIAKKVGIDAPTFSKKCDQYPVMAQALAEGRKKTSEMGSERPSLAFFRELTESCEGKVSRMLEALNVGYVTFRRWLAEDPNLQMEVDKQNLRFLEKLDTIAKLCATGVLKQVDAEGNDITKFPGFKLFPNSQLIMFYMNSMGAKYGYSAKEDVFGVMDASPISGDAAVESEEGVDVARWIELEMQEKAKKRQMDIEDAGKESVNNEENNQPSVS